jgi:hypothetical protein
MLNHVSKPRLLSSLALGLSEYFPWRFYRRFLLGGREVGRRYGGTGGRESGEGWGCFKKN